MGKWTSCQKCISFYQIIGLFGDVYQVTYPPAYLDFLSWFAVFKLDFAFVFRLDCLEGYNWYATLYTTLAAFFGLTALQAVLLLASFCCKRCCKLPPIFVTIAVVITYAVYPSFSNTLFQTFNCHSVNGTRFLRADYRINCDSDAHLRAQCFALLGIAFCSIGIPILYLFILYQAHRVKASGASGLLHGNVAGAACIAARTPRLRKPERTCNHETSGLAGTKAGPKVIV